jgi:hypothetical protein
MPTKLNFDNTKSLRESLINRNLNIASGVTEANLGYTNVVDAGEIDLTSKDAKNLFSKYNTYFPNELPLVSSDTIIKSYELKSYPYFVKSQTDNLWGIYNTQYYENESQLYKFAQKFINDDANGPIAQRIKQNLLRETIGKLRFVDASSGRLSTISNIIQGKEDLVQKNYSITVPSTITGKAVDFLSVVAGIESPFPKISGDIFQNPLNKTAYRKESDTETGRFIQDATGFIGSMLNIQRKPSVNNNPSDLLIKYTSEGQKQSLFDSLKLSKYRPDYSVNAINQNSSKIFDAIDNSIESVRDFLGLGAPTGNVYLGDGRSNDVKYAMSDSDGQIIKGVYSLSEMFDSKASYIFNQDTSFINTGSIVGPLTWVNKISKYNLDGNFIEQNSFNESLSTSKTFRTDSILNKTQEILNKTPDNSEKYGYVGHVIDQTSRAFKDGTKMISRGSGIKYVDKFNQQVTGEEFCRVWTKNDAYTHYSNTMKKGKNIRGFDGSVMSNPWNLNIAPMSDGKGSFEGSTNMSDNYPYGGGFYPKKFMFSIENLAWKNSNTVGYMVQDLPYSERGPNGGRIMWFPPYDVKISEDDSAKWNPTEIFGRPEQIYTYQNTERNGVLSFKIVVDHPSVLNLLSQYHFDGMSDEEVDNYLASFFAGCENVDFYSLIQNNPLLNSEELGSIQKYVDYWKYNKTIDERIKFKITNDYSQSQDNYVPTTNKTEITKTFSGNYYFQNNYPLPEITYKTNNDYSYYYENYYRVKNNTIQTLSDGIKQLFTNINAQNSQLKANDRKLLYGSDSLDTSLTGSTISDIDSGFEEMKTNFDNMTSLLNEIKSSIQNQKTDKIEVKIDSSSSYLSDIDFNLKLSYRRSYSMMKYILNSLSENGNIDFEWNNTTGNDTVTISFNKLGYNFNGNIIFNVNNLGENSTVSNVSSKSINCHDTSTLSTFNSIELKKTSPLTFFCRCSNVDIKYNVIQETNETVNQPSEANKNVQVVTENIPVSPPQEDLKKIIMKLLSESYYFKVIEETSPLVFSSLKEKLKYFHPTFHSTTPEGLNSRLTFLKQCTRPGDTIPNKNTTTDVRNSSFGVAPVCVIRFGDFFHSKIIIRSVNVSYDDDNIWDLNPEGIGVQPMIASVNMQITFIGGQGLEKPVETLQNALSSNFYANTEMYDPRSVVTTDTINGKKYEIFNSDILEQINLRKSVKKVESVALNNNTISEGVYLGKITNNQIQYDDILNSIFSGYNKYKSSINNYLAYLNTNYGELYSSYILNNNIRKNNQLNINDTNHTLIGNFKPDYDLTKLFNIISDELNKYVDNYGFNSIYNHESLLNEDDIDIFNEVLLETLNDKINKLMNDDNIVNYENELLTSKNEMILPIDIFNFLLTTSGHDSKIENNVYKTINLITYNSNVIYEKYEPVVDELDKITNKINDIILNNNSNFSDFPKMITIMLLKNIDYLQVSLSNIGIPSNIITKFTNKLNSIIQLNDIKYTLGSTLVNKSLNVLFDIESDGYELDNNEIEIFNKLKMENNINNETLNFNR